MGKAFRMSTGFDNATYSLMNKRGVGVSSRTAMGVAWRDATSEEKAATASSLIVVVLLVQGNDGIDMFNCSR